MLFIYKQNSFDTFHLNTIHVSLSCIFFFSLFLFFIYYSLSLVLGYNGGNLYGR